MAGATDRRWTTLKAKHVERLGAEFGLSAAAIEMALAHLAKRKDAAAEAIGGAEFGTQRMKDDLIELVKKR